MAMGRHKRERQGELWIATQDVPQSKGHPQGQRTLNPLRHKNFHQEAVIPTAVSTFAHDAVL